MAAVSFRSVWAFGSLLPRLSFGGSSSSRAPVLSALPALFPDIQIPRLPSLTDLWEGLLRAVPKKKTSHMKKRHRQMAGKALQDVHSFCVCPGCGQTKRMHRLCPHCMKRTYPEHGHD